MRYTKKMNEKKIENQKPRTNRSEPSEVVIIGPIALFVLYRM